MYKRLAIFPHLILSLLFLSTFTAIGQEPARQMPPEVKIEPAVFDVYTGQYEDTQNLAGVVFSFFREGVLRSRDQPGEDRDLSSIGIKIFS